MENGYISFKAVKRAVTLEAVLGHYGLMDGLVPRGENLAAQCPFCEHPKGRALRVSLPKNAWFCFGCKRGGNVLDFVVQMEKASLREAAGKLDEWFGLGFVTKNRPTEHREEASEEPAVPADAREPDLPRANPPLTFTLKTLDPAHEAVAALGLTDEVLREYGLGFCKRGILKDRIAIPIENRDGALVAYAGLAIDPAASPRYLLPPNFQPGLELFNRHRFPQTIPAEGSVYLASEIMAVLRLAAAGFSNMLGLFDGSLSEAQEAGLLDLLPPETRLVLVGSGFEATVFQRLARTFALKNLATVDLPADPDTPPLAAAAATSGQEDT